MNKPLHIDIALTPNDIRGEYEPVRYGEPGEKPWPERYAVDAIRIAGQWVPTWRLDDETRTEIEHYALACIREEREQAEAEMRAAS